MSSLWLDDYDDDLCRKWTFSRFFSDEKLGMHIVHRNCIISFFPATCLIKFRMSCLKVSYIYHHHYQIKLIAQIPLTLSCHPSLLAGPLDCIQCLYKADIYKSLLISQHWCVHVLESTGESKLMCFLPLQRNIH